MRRRVKKTRATVPGVPRSRSKMTRSTRKAINHELLPLLCERMTKLAAASYLASCGLADLGGKVMDLEFQRLKNVQTVKGL